MARHADTANTEVSDEAPNATEGVTSHRRWSVRVLACTVVALATVCGWLGHQDEVGQRDLAARLRFVETGRQAALNLTTIDFNHADADVARIMDSATGAFLEDFKNRAKPFADIVKQARSTSQGTVTDAGIESIHDNGAQVLVGVRVNTATDGAPAPDVRQWRMRIDVQSVGDDCKVANVEFVQ